MAHLNETHISSIEANWTYSPCFDVVTLMNGAADLWPLMFFVLPEPTLRSRIQHFNHILIVIFQIHYGGICRENDNNSHCPNTLEQVMLPW